MVVSLTLQFIIYRKKKLSLSSLLKGVSQFRSVQCRTRDRKTHCLIGQFVEEMPENSSIHHDQLAQFSKECARRVVSLEDADEDDDSCPQDIGELLGFRITGGRDFFMPITIFHVNIILSHYSCQSRCECPPSISEYRLHLDRVFLLIS